MRNPVACVSVSGIPSPLLSTLDLAGAASLTLISLFLYAVPDGEAAMHS